MSVYDKQELRRGDRCVVMDLRIGKTFAGVIEKETVSTDPQRVIVKRDADGALVRVGVGFVRLEASDDRR